MAVTKRKRKNKPKQKVDSNKLNLNQKTFCELYTKNSALFGNATICYGIAYGYELDTLSQESEWSEYDEFGKREKLSDSPYDMAYNVCSVEGNRLLRNPKINEYINSLLNSMMTNEDADAELSWVMKQRTDMGPKVQALREFNKLKSRIVNNIEITGITIDKNKKEKANSIINSFLKNARDTTTENPR